MKIFSISSTPLRVLFLCTGNSCRSQMAEAMVNHDLAGRWKAFRAGTPPTGYVHPLALKALEEIGALFQGTSKSVVVFRQVRDAMRTRLLAALEAFSAKEK